MDRAGLRPGRSRRHHKLVQVFFQLLSMGGAIRRVVFGDAFIA
jgi:hypothetical protein